MRQRGIAPGDELPLDLEAGIDDAIEKIAGRVVGEEVDPSGHVEPIYENDADAVRFADMVFGRTLPIAQELERFIGEKDYPPRTADKVRRAVDRLQEYLSEDGQSDDVGRLRVETAGRFVDHLYGTGLATPTVNDHVSKLRTYWKWLVVRMGVTANPWDGQTRKKKKSEATAKKRPYTADEIRILLTGDTTRTLHDLMRIAALSGMRIEEMARQTVGSARSGMFSVREGKTEASTRDIPIHSGLSAVIARRIAGKADDDLLFHELKPPPSAMKERSNRASNAYTIYRRRMGVDERSEGQRQSNVDFHSFRRWAATQAEEAGHLGQTISLVLGHVDGRRGMTLGRYSKPQAMEAKRAIVESIRLPDGVPLDSPEGPLMGDRRHPQRPRDQQ